MQKPIASLMVVGLLILAACGTEDTVEPGPVTSFEDIAGTIYELQGVGGPDFIYFTEDGNLHGSSSRDLVVDRPIGLSETRFEGTTLFLHRIKGQCLSEELLDGTYEIHLLENGNLTFVVIEDPCAFVVSWLTREWAPVP